MDGINVTMRAHVPLPVAENKSERPGEPGNINGAQIAMLISILHVHLSDTMRANSIVSLRFVFCLIV